MTTWESAAIIIAMASLVAAVASGTVKIIHAIRAEGAATRATAERAVALANGFPLLVLQHMPLPAWYKDADGKMRFINSAYTLAFQIRPEEYIGRKDRDIWPPDTATQFARSDDKVKHHGVEMHFVEEVPDRAMMDDAPKNAWYVIKFPYRNSMTGEIQGIAGVAIPVSMMQSGDASWIKAKIRECLEDTDHH